MEAHRSDGHGVSLHTDYKGGTHDPVWNKNLDFGTNTWTKFTVQVFDADDFLSGADDTLSDKETYDLNSHIAGTTVVMGCYRGEIVFTYSFTT